MTSATKPVQYAPIPEFDQRTHYIVQLPPVEEENRIFVGVEVRELSPDTGGKHAFIPPEEVL